MNKWAISFYVYCLFLSLELVSRKVSTSHVSTVYEISPPFYLLHSLHILLWYLLPILGPLLNAGRIFYLPSTLSSHSSTGTF